jgi:outer membrane protein OmpA-like peptidoglycan-associated protein
MYGFEVSAKEYMYFIQTEDFTSLPDADVYTRDFKINQIVVGSKMVLKNIFFETGKATIMDASIPEMDRVVQMMKDNPDLKLEISGFTDNVGSVASNTKLSQARAQSVVNYLVLQGIDKSRLTAKGYGPLQPVASNKTKAGKEKNRRVEFKVLGN